MSAAPGARSRTVVIVGGGPVASALATLIARQGVKTVMIYKPRRGAMIVGESLVPAVIPILRMLGVEDKVKAFSMLKPGATFGYGAQATFSFFFKQTADGIPGYAYNVPREAFDDALLAAAREAGARIVEGAASMTSVKNTDRVELSAETLRACGLEAPPDLLVDASGRVRLLPNLLEMPSRRGEREDAALFAHVDTTDLNHAGHVHSTRIDHGWSWRIPLPGRVSVGMVIGAQHLPKDGVTKEERFDNLLRNDSVLKVVARGAARITPVMEYTNYQLVSERVIGDGWALVGDTAGFIDPVFSSGLLIGLQGAVALAAAIKAGTPEAMQHYQESVIHNLKTWHEIVGYYYDGRLFTCFRVGEMLREKLLMRLLYPHINKHMGQIFSGTAATSPYSMRLLRFAMKYGFMDEDPREMQIGDPVLTVAKA